MFKTELPTRYCVQSCKQCLRLLLQRSGLRTRKKNYDFLIEEHLIKLIALETAAHFQVARNDVEDNSYRLGVDSNFLCSSYGVLPHPTHCDFFYICYGSKPAHLWRCKKDFLYDVQHNRCRHSKLVTSCVNRIRPK